MANEHTTLADFVARGESPDEWRMVIVEEGPWTGPLVAELTRVQNRLYGLLDAALDGQLAERFPESKGKTIVIQLDAYNVPKAEVGSFFERFSRGALETPDYRRALESSEFVQGISFRVNFESIS